jgi:hypothetical protein
LVESPSLKNASTRFYVADQDVIQQVFGVYADNWTGKTRRGRKEACTLDPHLTYSGAHSGVRSGLTETTNYEATHVYNRILISAIYMGSQIDGHSRLLVLYIRYSHGAFKDRIKVG